MVWAALLAFALSSPLGQAPSVDADETAAALKKSKGKSVVLLENESESLFARAAQAARPIHVPGDGAELGGELGRDLVAPFTGSCMADVGALRPDWCDEFVEADLKKNKSEWLAQNGSVLWQINLPDEHWTLSDYDFKSHRFTLKYVPQACDLEAQMCITTAITKLKTGANVAAVVGAFEQGPKRFTAAVSIAADEANARALAEMRDTSSPLSFGTTGDLQFLFRIGSTTKRMKFVLSDGINSLAMPFTVLEVVPVALRVVSDDKTVIEYYF